VGDINLADGSWVAAEAGRGAFNQRAERLVLEENVRLFHDKGYEFLTARLLIDMGARIAWSDAAVQGQGPAGTLTASGVRAESATGTVIFTGPAKLVLNRSVRGL
jgi:lipopolysaccharide export system protein LptC